LFWRKTYTTRTTLNARVEESHYARLTSGSKDSADESSNNNNKNKENYVYNNTIS
jgi:hypothetical protein